MIRALIFTLFCLVAACYAALTLLAGDNGLTQVFLIGELKTAARCLVSVLGVVVLLRYMDLLLGVDFKAWLQGAPSNEKAIYFSARVVAFCLLFGLLANASV